MVEATTINTLSSIGPNSYLSINEATAPDNRPHNGMEGVTDPPMKNPKGRQTIAIPRLPHALLVRFLNIKFLIIPVTPSPNAMNSAGKIANQGSLE